MSEREWLTARFEENRDHLLAVAYRMLGTLSEADDAVQESWLRLNRADTHDVENLTGWLTTVVARVCLDMLRSRKVRREDDIGGFAPEPAASDQTAIDAESELALADSVGPALLLVLETLSPAERVAFVLHDVFDLSFEEIAPIVGRSVDAARQLGSRARRRVKGEDKVPAADRGRQREIVDAFLAASRHGDFNALLAVLHPDAVLRADALAVQTAASYKARGAPELSGEVRGARAVAEAFKGRARGAQRALIDGCPGAVWAPRGQTQAAFVFTIANDQVVEIELLMDPSRIVELDVEILSVKAAIGPE